MDFFCSAHFPLGRSRLWDAGGLGSNLSPSPVRPSVFMSVTSLHFSSFLAHLELYFSFPLCVSVPAPLFYNSVVGVDVTCPGPARLSRRPYLPLFALPSQPRAYIVPIHRVPCFNPGFLCFLFLFHSSGVPYTRPACCLLPCVPSCPGLVP